MCYGFPMTKNNKTNKIRTADSKGRVVVGTPGVAYSVTPVKEGFILMEVKVSEINVKEIDLSKGMHKYVSYSSWELDPESLMSAVSALRGPGRSLGATFYCGVDQIVNSLHPDAMLKAYDENKV